MKLLAIALVVVAWTMAACSTTRPVRALPSQGDYCEPSMTYAYNEKYAPLSTILVDSSLTNSFSQHDLLMANAIGILPLLRGINELEKKNTVEDHLERLSKVQEMQNRLLTASADISSLAAELDCEGERANQSAVYLDQINQRRVRTLTVLSIVVGGITTVTTALTNSNRVDKIVGISGGLLSAGLGGSDIFLPDKTVLFVHQRNLLADIWTDSRNSTTYSPFIWYMLNEKLFSKSGKESVRAHVRQRWHEYVLVGLSVQAKEMYFGAGGVYVADDLHKRADMLNQLQSTVRSINQDLKSLILNLAVVFK